MDICEEYRIGTGERGEKEERDYLVTALAVKREKEREKCTSSRGQKVGLGNRCFCWWCSVFLYASLASSNTTCFIEDRRISTNNL